MKIKLDKNNINNNAFGLLLNEWVFILKQSLSQWIVRPSTRVFLMSVRKVSRFEMYSAQFISRCSEQQKHEDGAWNAQFSFQDSATFFLLKFIYWHDKQAKLHDQLRARECISWISKASLCTDYLTLNLHADVAFGCVRAADLFWLIVFGPLAICFVLKTLLRPQMDWSWNFKMIKNIICRGKISLYIYVYVCVFVYIFRPWSLILNFHMSTSNNTSSETLGNRRTEADRCWM